MFEQLLLGMLFQKDRQVVVGKLRVKYNFILPTSILTHF